MSFNLKSCKYKRNTPFRKALSEFNSNFIKEKGFILIFITMPITRFTNKKDWSSNDSEGPGRSAEVGCKVSTLLFAIVTVFLGVVMSMNLSE